MNFLILKLLNFVFEFNHFLSCHENLDGRSLVDDEVFEVTSNELRVLLFDPVAHMSEVAPLKNGECDGSCKTEHKGAETSDRRKRPGRFLRSRGLFQRCLMSIASEVLPLNLVRVRLCLKSFATD